LRTMTLTVLDPRTGKLVTIVVAEKGHQRRSLQVAAVLLWNVVPMGCAHLQ
jgi:hypothetical protein